MKKVLVIAPYRDGTGWSHSSEQTILALDAVDIDVVPRAIKLNDVSGEVSERIVELEKKSTKGADIVIQYLLPHQLDYSGHFQKNIAYYMTETSHFRNTSWPQRINTMDEAWVPCEQNKTAAVESFVTKPIHVVPVPADTEKYQKKYEKLSIPQLKDKFVFYHIGEVNRRKNLATLVKAFHLEFGPQEPVALVIKGVVPGASVADTEKHIAEICNQTKKHLKLYNRVDIYHGEIIISQRLTEEQIMGLHASCDCYVSPSYGEAWNIPAFDAMAMGKTPICTNIGGPSDYLDAGKEDAGWLIPWKKEPVFGMEGTFDDLYVGNEDWAAIDIYRLRLAMRAAFEDKELREQKAEAGIARANDYSQQAVGMIMKGLLDE